MDGEPGRKFYFDPSKWSGTPKRTQPLEQGYLADTGLWEIRLRQAGTEHRYTMRAGSGPDRVEWDVPLTDSDFRALWARTGGQRIAKVREKHLWKGLTVEVDRYSGVLEGLTVAEVEFGSPAQARAFSPPPAFGPELTYDDRFKGRHLALAPSAAPRKPPGPGAVGWSYGVLPFRRGPKGWELIVVSTRRQDRWIFPKGQPEPGMSPQKVALAEAREEAGITGKVAGHPLVFPYVRETGTTNLLLFPVLVTGLADRWLELGQRERQVVPLARAEAYGEVVALGARWLRDYAGTVGP